MGWERANWFAPAGSRSRWSNTLGAPELVRRTARPSTGAAREHVALFDQTSFAKIAVRGADAEAALQYLCSNDVAVPAGPDRVHGDPQ